MADEILTAEVWLWEWRVGAVAELPDGQVVFEFDPPFRRTGLEVSPRMLPLSVEGPRSFPELAGTEAFEGLPGVLADALPDRFGNRVIRQYFENRGRPEAALSPVQKLLYVGSRAMGALEFRPPLRERHRDATEALEIARLVEQARALIEGRVETAMPEIMRIGSSAGGARPKAVVLWNPDRQEMRSAFARPQDGDEPWIVKFDGVGELDAPDPRPRPYNRIEFAYACMAVQAGIDMAPVHLLEERRLAHFMTRRFDRVDGRRLHMHTLGGMEHVDYNVPGAYSYEQFFRLIQDLELGYPALEEGYRRAAFNIVAVNQDDHVKNLAFLMDAAGRWTLAPAYDLTHARGAGYTRRHQMTFAGKTDGFTADDLLDVGRRFGLRAGGREILADIGAALEAWPRHAAEAGVPPDKIAAIQDVFRRECLPR
jgi:serine/threonine-protein kinase HipA